MSGTPTYVTWVTMRRRCNNKNFAQYPSYGGRGISVCARWDDFENFLADMGYRPDGLTLERIDNDGDYAPDNCRWATHKEQCNNRRSSRLIEMDGETKTLAQWCEDLGVSYGLVSMRIRLGWSEEDALKERPKKFTYVELDGDRMTVNKAAKYLGLSPRAVYARIGRGWTVLEALGIEER
jgi:hypothetical protein